MLRISHAHRELRRSNTSIEAVVHSWRRGHRRSLTQALRQTAKALARRFKNALAPEVLSRPRGLQGTRVSRSHSDSKASAFASAAKCNGNVESNKDKHARVLV